MKVICTTAFTKYYKNNNPKYQIIIDKCINEVNENEVNEHTNNYFEYKQVIKYFENGKVQDYKIYLNGCELQIN